MGGRLSWGRFTQSVAALLLGGCTIDTPAVVAERACAPSPAYFAAQVWPGYLEANRCGSSGCHAFDDGHGTLRLRAPTSPAPASDALDPWPYDWRENYLSTLQLIDCAMPRESLLLIVPEGRDGLHPPGPSVLDRATAHALVRAWVTGLLP